jgi:hypothetical protein
MSAPGFFGGTWRPYESAATLICEDPDGARLVVIGTTVHDGSGPIGSRALTPAELDELAARLNGPAPAVVPSGGDAS